MSVRVEGLATSEHLTDSGMYRIKWKRTWSVFLVFFFESAAFSAYRCHCKDNLEESFPCVSSPSQCSQACPRQSSIGVGTSQCDPNAAKKPDIWINEGVLYGVIAVSAITGLRSGQHNPPCGNGVGTSICEKLCISAPTGKKLGQPLFFLKDEDQFGGRDYRNYKSCPEVGECGYGHAALTDIVATPEGDTENEVPLFMASAGCYGGKG